MAILLSLQATAPAMGFPAQDPVSQGMGASQLLMLAGAVFGLTLLMLTTRKRFMQRARDKAPSIRQRAAGLARETEHRRSLDAVIIDLDQLAREIHAQIDTRFAKLESVIRDADQRIATLTRLQESAPDSAPAARHLLDITLSSESPAPPGLGDAPGNIAATDSSAARGSTDHQPILSLAAEGLSPSEIAERVGRPIGEVELILSLQRAAPSNGASSTAAPVPTSNGAGDAYVA